MARKTAIQAIAMSLEPQQSRFVKKNDGTVFDTHTGLMWMRFALGQEWDGKTCKGTASQNTWTQAVEISNSFYEFAGYFDWRLPDIDELKSIVDRKAGAPAIDSSAFPNTPPSHFWSLTCDVDGTHRRFVEACYVNFQNGNVHKSSTNSRSYIRLVRKEFDAASAYVRKSSGSSDDQAPAPGKVPERADIRLVEGVSPGSVRSDEQITFPMSTSAARGILLAAIDLIRAQPALFDEEIGELRQILSKAAQALEPEHGSGFALPSEISSPTSLPEILACMLEVNSLPLTTLRRYLLPLDLMPSAFIGDLNEKAIDLIGDPALEENGDRVLVFRDVLVQVVESLEANRGDRD